MLALINSQSVGANFAILIIIRLSNRQILDIGSWLFTPNNNYVYKVPITLEEDVLSSSEADNDNPLLAFGRRVFTKLGLRSRATCSQNLQLRDAVSSGVSRKDSDAPEG